MLCCALLCVHSSFATISMGKRELVALLCLSSWCPMIVVWLFLTIPWVCLQFVIALFPDHTHLLFMLQRSVAHPGSLTNAFVNRFLLNSIMYLTLATHKRPIFWLVSVAERTGFNL